MQLDTLSIAHNTTAKNHADQRGGVKKFVRMAKDMGLNVNPPAIARLGASIRVWDTKTRKLGHKGILPEVLALIETKGHIRANVSSGKQIISKENIDGLGALFYNHELATMVSYGEYLKNVTQQREFFTALLKKVSATEISQSDIDEISTKFGKTSSLKMVIAYNDWLRTSNPEKMLREDKETAQLRGNIAKLKSEENEISSMLKLLNGLKVHKFKNPNEFFRAFQSIGSYSVHWMLNIRRIDRLYLIKYAVGDNAKVKNPCIRGKYLNSTSKLPDYSEDGLQKHITELKKSRHIIQVKIESILA